MDDVAHFPLARLQICFQQNRRHADDAVHRCANFVTHRREKFRLQPRRFQRLIACGGQRDFRVFALSHIDRRADNSGDRTVAVNDRGGATREPTLLAFEL